jgi:hypothetical protein
MDDRPYGCRGRLGGGCLGIILAVTLCVGGLMAAADSACYASLTHRLPVYPGAEVITERHNFLRAWGMGETVMILYSPDPPEVVTGWYGRTIGTRLYEQVTQGVGPPRFGETDWTVGRAEDGVGSQIILYGKCVK